MGGRDALLSPLFPIFCMSCARVYYLAGAPLSVRVALNVLFALTNHHIHIVYLNKVLFSECTHAAGAQCQGASSCVMLRLFEHQDISTRGKCLINNAVWILHFLCDHDINECG